jgi:hypothetical protein
MAVMSVSQSSYSSFLRGPTTIVPLLDEGDVILERRDGQDLVLSTVSRFEARERGAALTGRLLGDFMAQAPEAVRTNLEKELPWLRWLPEVSREMAVAEILDNLLAGAHTGTLTPFALTVSAWQDTAEILSDPVLSKRLSGQFRGSEITLTRPGSQQ